MTRFRDRRASRRKHLPFLAIALSCTVGCFKSEPTNGHPDTQPDAADTRSCVSTSECVEVLATGTYSAFERTWTYELLRLGERENGAAYAIWIPPPGESAGGTVLVPNPYDGIDWSEEAVDRRWATEHSEAGCYPDADAPGYQAGVSAPTCYNGTQAPTAAINPIIHILLNDLGCLIVYGRFYAGGSAVQYIDNIVTGLEFLSVQENVVPSRVGVLGLSLGGFEALHGAARAPDNIKPLVGVGISPLLDFEEQVHYAQTFLPDVLLPDAPSILDEYEEFFDPYLRRVFADTGGPPGHDTDYSAVNLGALVHGLQGEYLVIHDDWDTLVPSGPSRKLAAEHHGVDGFWYPHEHPINFGSFEKGHAQTSEGETQSVTMAFGLSFVITRVIATNGNARIPYKWNELATFFAYIRRQQQLGTSIDWLVPRLLDLADPRVTMFDTGPDQVGQAPGYRVVGLFLNAVWDAKLREEHFETEVAAYLKSDGLR